MTNEELIERARRVGTNDVVANPRGHRALIADLADALEAAAKVETARVRDAAIERAERAEAAIERVREMHNKVEVFAGADFRPLTECSRCGDDEPYVYPCVTVAALDTGKEKNDE